MNVSRPVKLITPALPVLALAACATPNHQPQLAATYQSGLAQNTQLTNKVQDTTSTVLTQESSESTPSTSSDSRPFSFIQYGDQDTDQTVDEIAPEDEQRDIIINLSNVPIGDAIQHVLGDVLGENYVLEASLSGELSIHTTRPVTRSGAIRLLTSALSSKNVTLVRDQGFYRIVQTTRNDPGSQKAGQVTRFISTNFVSAASLEPVLIGLHDSALEVSIDTGRNMIILRGQERLVADAEAIVDLFDVNWMRGKSIAAYPVRFTSPTRIVEELEMLFGSGQGGPVGDFVRFIPLERLNTVITITQQRAYIDDAQAWIERLDRSDGQAGQRLYVLPVENRPASEIGNILRDIMTGEAGNTSEARAGLHPTDTPILSGDDIPAAGRFTDIRATDGGASGGLPAPRIFADEANNTLVAYASPEQFTLLERAVSQLDRVPNQVFLEVTIAEITLSDDLAFGLTWFFQSGEFDMGFSDVSNGAVASQFPGFSLLFSGQDGRAALSAVAGATDVKILSAPSLMVLDNRTATLQVGDQVPIITQSAVSMTNPDAPIVNSVSLRDTGIILNVTPRVNDGGLVLLDIDQEVSDVVSTQSSGIDSPTIQQRRITTSVAVKNGSSIALAGLMRERLSDTETKVPFLGDLPLFGSAFRTQKNSAQRTELLVMITPRIVAGQDETALVTQDLIRRMQGLERTYFPAQRIEASGAGPAIGELIDEEVLFSDDVIAETHAQAETSTGS